MNAAHDKTRPELTIVILCRNEENAIAHCVTEAREFLASASIRGEVLVVDNGSTDASAAVAAAAGARVIHEAQPGYGNAISAGIAAAQGEFIIIGDGDGEHDLRNLEAFWQKLQSGYEFVIGNRFKGEVADGAMPSFIRRTIGNPLLSGLGKLIHRAPVGDFHCGLRGFNAEKIRALQLNETGMAMAGEMIVKVVRAGLRIAEVPIAQRKALDPARQSHLQVWRDGWRAVYVLLMLSPRWLLLFPGYAMLAAGAALMALPFVATADDGILFGAYTLAFGAVSIICGLQTVTFYWLASALLATPAAAFHSGKHRAFAAAFGVLLIAVGVAGCIFSFVIWTQTGPAQPELRLGIAIPSITALICGLQMLFSVIFLELLLQNRGQRQ